MASKQTEYNRGRMQGRECGGMKEICKNCANCKPTYKGYFCDKSYKRKKIKLQGTCEDWKPKN